MSGTNEPANIDPAPNPVAAGPAAAVPDAAGPSPLTRRGLLLGTAAVAGAGLLDRRDAHAEPVRQNPFALGVASGDPLPDGVVLWTRLVADPTTRPRWASGRYRCTGRSPLTPASAGWCGAGSPRPGQVPLTRCTSTCGASPRPGSTGTGSGPDRTSARPAGPGPLPPPTRGRPGSGSAS